MQLLHNVRLPNINGLHSNRALKGLGGNPHLYLRVLKDFARNHKNLNLRDFDEELFCNMIRSLKFFCGSIGALTLCEKIEQLNHKNNFLCIEIEHELALLINDIEEFFRHNHIDT